MARTDAARVIESSTTTAGRCASAATGLASCPGFEYLSLGRPKRPRYGRTALVRPGVIADLVTMQWWVWIALAVVVGLVVVVVYDLLQRQHAILRNFPIVGHLRYLLESVGPELRQYIVTDNRQERPFDRDQRRWIYASAKGENNNFSSGSDVDLEVATDHVVVDQSMFPLPRPEPDDDRVPCAKVLGAARDRRAKFRPASVVNSSAMSFGALSGSRSVRSTRVARWPVACTTAARVGSARIISTEASWSSRSGRATSGVATARAGSTWSDWSTCAPSIRCVPSRSSSARAPSLVSVGSCRRRRSHAIAAARDVEPGQDCRSPSAHTAFADVDSLLDFVETIAEHTGLAVGIKSAVGTDQFWVELAERMRTTGRGVDFITVDGGEGGTGDAPLAFSDHVSLPFKLAMTRVYRTFAEREMADDVVFIGSGRLGMPDSALVAMALGCDMVNVAREAMLAIGCIQAQRCHTGSCPVGITTHSTWRTHGLDPALKSVRLANYISMLRHELLELSHACGVAHPALVGADRIEILDGHLGTHSLLATFGYGSSWGQPSPSDRLAIQQLMSA